MKNGTSSIPDFQRPIRSWEREARTLLAEEPQRHYPI